MSEENIKTIMGDIEKLIRDIVTLSNRNQKNESAIVCPNCGREQQKITDSRKRGGTITRTRCCLKCGEVWKTIEVKR